ncbi:MAG: PEP-CTERM sorting domain-containing protein [Verrucomicrobiaceae bacterium]|nr:PEP-CTERM sorting domain-containing protein [Verrucomicrobiaceae bacterium]
MSLPHYKLPILVCLGLLALPEESVAYLGSFEELDGYRVPQNGSITSLGFAGDAMFYLNNNSANGFTGIVPASTFPNTLGDLTHGPDITRYNAGLYGTNAGGPGGGAADIIDNTGAWTALLGGRLNEDLGGTLANGYQYFGNTSTGNIFLQNRDYVHAYRYGAARNGTQVLNLLAQDTSLRYNYALDSRDLGGTNPAATANSIIAMTFWFCPADTDDTDVDNLFGLTLRDAAGQSVVEVGYTGENIVQYRLPGGGGWISTGSTAGSQGWSEMNVTLNTATDVVSLSVRAYDDINAVLGTTTTLLANQVLGLDAGALTDLRWDLRGGPLNNGAVSYKNYFEDFSFAVTPVPVPEPGSALCAALGWLFLARRRRSNLTS